MMFWNAVFVILQLSQYLVGERYFIEKKGQTKIGYTFSLSLFIVCLLIGSYFLAVRGPLGILGIMYPIVAIWLWFKFINRQKKGFLLIT